MRWLVVLLALARVAAAGPAPIERTYDATGDLRYLVALPDGGALAVTERGLLRFATDGTVRRLSRPGGSSVIAAFDGTTVWIADGAVISRGTLGTGEIAWSTQRLDVTGVVATYVLPSATGATVVIESADARARTVIFDLDAKLAVAQRTGLDVVLEHVVSDGSGGLWATVHRDRRQLGYTHVTATRRMLWRTDPGARPPAGFAVEPAPLRSPIHVLIADGRGGIYAVELAGLRGDDIATHIASDGATTQVTTKLAFTCGAADPATGELVVIGHQARATTFQRFAVDGTSSSEVLPRPAWMQKAHVDPIPGGCAVAKGWLAYGPIVLSRGGSPAIYSRTSAVAAASRPPRRPRRSSLGSILFGAAITAGGAYAASQLHDESVLVTAGEIGGGFAGGSIATALVFVVAANNKGDSDAGLAGALVLGLVALPTGIALGTWGIGELTDGSQHSGRALGGAFLGTVSGAITGALVSRLLGFKERNTAATVLGFTLVGSTFGYQLLGGGPPP